MSDNRGGRNGRRNDSVSSVMSLGADNTTPSWVDDSAPATQRPSRAEDTQLQALDHEASVNMISQYGSGHASYNDSSDLASSEQSDDTMSDTQLRHAIFEILDSMPDEDLLVFYQKAPMIPPVTQESLGELDVGRIINNPKLRHDVNFDRELHFRPNLDGTKGKNKLKSSHQFWEALLAELEVYRALGHRLIECQSAEDMEDLQRMIKANQLRLPGVFTTIQNVLKTLIPERDQIIVAERLDVDMIMQQICKGVFNILDLAEWLAGVLKAHCAPMRDEWIDRMVGEMTEGVERGDQRAVMTGLRETVSILEAMKLDVANHQIRNLRTLLINDTINFQQKFHCHKIAGGRFNLTHAQAWFQQEARYLASCSLTPTPLEIFVSALLRSLLNQTSVAIFPETFHLDIDRLRTIRNDFHGIVQALICCNAFDLLAEGRLDEQTRAAGRKMLEANLVDIVGETRQHNLHVENISVEIVRLVLQLQGANMTYHSDMIDVVEKHLRTEFLVMSPAFGHHLHALLNSQLPRLVSRVNSNSRLGLLDLHDAMLPSIQTATQRVALMTAAEPLIDELLKRVTHLAVIHWHIWSPIVYDVQIEQDVSSSDKHDTSGGSDASQMNVTSLSPTAAASTPEMQCQASGFGQTSGPSLVNNRPQE